MDLTKVFPKLDNNEDVSHLVWKTKSREEKYSCPIFKINEVQRQSTDNRESTFVEVSSTNWVTMIPYFTDDKGQEFFIMEKQYRHGSDSVTIEFPAGLIEKGEEAEAAAKRELLEETGLECSNCLLLGDVSPNPAFMTNRNSFFLLSGLRLVSSQKLDANEQLDVVYVPVEQAIQSMGTGRFDNGMMMLALGFYLRLKLNGEIK